MCSSLENDQLWEISHHPVMIICLEQQASMRFIPFVKACGLYSESQWGKKWIPYAGLLCKAIWNSMSIQTSVSARRKKKKKKRKKEGKKKRAGWHSAFCITCLHLFTSFTTEDKTKLELAGWGCWQKCTDFHSDIIVGYVYLHQHH